MIPAEKSIEHRPEVANNRNEYGHWEGDLVIGKRKKCKKRQVIVFFLLITWIFRLNAGLKRKV